LAAVFTRPAAQSRHDYGLNSLDFSFLLRGGVVWDGRLIVLSILAVASAATSVVVSRRRVARTRRFAPVRLNDAALNR
jgi:hypothetical protein